MKVLLSKFYFLIPLCLVVSSQAQSDTTLNEKNTLLFARYLSSNQIYHLAAQEYERLIFINPNVKQYHKELFSSYRLSNNYAPIMQRTNSEFLKIPEIRLEYSLGAIASDKLDFAEDLISDTDFFKDKNLENTANDIKDCISLLKYRRVIDAKSQNPIVNNLSVMFQNVSLKSPALAGTYSALVPGLGRIYSKDYTNGLLSFVFVASTAWQAYRRFKQNGISSFSGWIYAGFSTGFYLGNIYGSIKSAKKYNQKQFQSLDEKTKNYILNINF